jgi:hypothetical protein
MLSNRHIYLVGALAILIAAGSFFISNTEDLQGRLELTELVRCMDGEFYMTPAYDRLVDPDPTNPNPLAEVSIQGAVDSSMSEDVIVICPSTYAEEVEVRSKDLHFFGLGAEGAVTLDGEGLHRLFYAYDGVNLTLENLILQNGYEDFGGAIYLEEDANIRFDNVELRNNEAHQNGGAISASANNKVFFNNSALRSNSAEMNGGAIYLYDDSELAIRNSVFEDNFAVRTAGVIGLFKYNRITINNSQFKGNQTDGDGGIAFSVGFNSFLVEDSTFSNNVALDDSAGFYLYDHSVFEVYNSSFIGNESDDLGVFFLSKISDLSIKDSLFQSNHSGGAGGLIHSLGSEVKIGASSFIDNYTESNFMIYATVGSSLLVRDSDFVGNVNGVIESGNVEISDSRFVGNFTDGDRHALIQVSNGILSLDSSVFENNSSFDSPINIENSEAYITNSEFIGNNTNEYDGAVLYFYAYSFGSIVNSIFEGNKIGSDDLDSRGGAIAVLTGSELDIAGVDFIENEASLGAGSVYLGYGTTVTVSDSNFMDNLPNNCLDILTDLGGNIDSDGTCF